MREQVIEILSRTLPQVEFENADALLEDGIVDSNSRVTIIS